MQHTTSVVVESIKCSNNENADSWTSCGVLMVKSNQQEHVNDVQLCAAILLSGKSLMSLQTF